MQVSLSCTSMSDYKDAEMVHSGPEVQSLTLQILIHSQEHNNNINCRNMFKVLNKITKNVSLNKRFLLL